MSGLVFSVGAIAEITENTFETGVEEFTESTLEVNDVDFTDPTAAYSSLQVGYTTEGVDLGFGYAKSLTDDWAGLAYAQSLDSFDSYRVRAAALSTNFGTGLMGDYIYNTNNRIHTSALNIVQVLPLHERILLAPVLGVGAISGESLDKNVPIATAQLYTVFRFTDDVSMMVAPAYTKSLSDQTMKINTLDWDGNISYRVNGNQNVSFSYSIKDIEDNTYGVNYTYAF